MAFNGKEHTNIIVSFDGITKDQKNELRKRVLNSGKLARVFVHPFYEEYINSPCWRKKERFPRVDLPAIGMERILSKPIYRTPPVIVFEERAHLKETESKLSKMVGNGSNVVYLVPTKVDTSTPDLYDTNKKTRRLFGFRDSWGILIDTFREVKINKVLLGGQRLTVETGNQFRSNNGETYEVGRCVGLALEHFCQSFEVEVSCLTHPHSRADINNFDSSKYRGADERFFEEMYIRE